MTGWLTYIRSQFGTLAEFQFGTSAASNFEGLVGYRTLCDEGLKAYDFFFGRVFQAFVCTVACLCHLYIQSLLTLCRGDGSSFALVRRGNVKTVLYVVNECAREARRLGGSGGMPPQEIIEFQAL